MVGHAFPGCLTFAVTGIGDKTWTSANMRQLVGAEARRCWPGSMAEFMCERLTETRARVYGITTWVVRFTGKMGCWIRMHEGLG